VDDARGRIVYTPEFLRWEDERMALDERQTA